MEKEVEGRKVNIIKWVGVAVFLVGMVTMGAYSLYPIFGSDVEESTMLFGIKVSVAMMGIGAVIVILTMSFERYKEWKKMKEEISEEELRP